jgi:hypothetical protein
VGKVQAPSIDSSFQSFDIEGRREMKPEFQEQGRKVKKHLR